MPLFSPKRYQEAFLPVHPPKSIGIRLFTFFERWMKDWMFGCRMCGNCILQETALICPMTCAKGLRNGMCGGSTPEKCYVDEGRKCTWYLIFERSEKWNRNYKLLEVNAPIDGARAGHETWLDVFRVYGKRRKGPNPLDFFGNREKFWEEWEGLFCEIRQPDWWKGDSEYHPPAYEEPVSFLEAHLRTGKFTVTAEIAPPLGATSKPIETKAAFLKDYIVSANFTDNASSVPRMSSIASSILCQQFGIEAVMQLQARDRTRVALESEAMGAAGAGIRNILCLSGDHYSIGPGPIAVPNQIDMDVVQVLWMLRRMRDEGIYIDGRSIKNPAQWPRFFLGAGANPYAALPRYEAIREHKKVNAGAQFIQTQPIFEIERFHQWMEEIEKRGILDKVYVMPGLIPLKSARAAHFMAEEVPGVVIPPEIVARMDKAAESGKEAAQEEGVQIALEIIEEIRKTPGVSGMHVMAVHWEDIVPRLIDESGIEKPDFGVWPPKEEKAGATA